VNESTLLVRATLALYRDAARDAARSLARNLWIVVLPPAFSLLLGFVQQIAIPLGMIGGFVIFLAAAACVSSFLSVIAEAIAHERIRPGELGQTFGRYVASIAGVLFVFWIIELLLTLITQQNPGLGWLAIVINLGLFLLCNPLPELIYQGTRDGIALVDDAVQFMRENAVEWLVPMGVLFCRCSRSAFARRWSRWRRSARPMLSASSTSPCAPGCRRSATRHSSRCSPSRA
jgi:hypothetical protein